MWLNNNKAFTIAHQGWSSTIWFPRWGHKCGDRRIWSTLSDQWTWALKSELSDGCTHCLTSKGPCLRGTSSQGLCWASKLLTQGQREGEIWIMNVFAVLGRGEGKEAAEHGAGSAADGFLCPTWAMPTHQLPREAVNRPPTSSLSQAHTNHHYHISQAHTNTHPHALRSTALSSQASPHTAQTCKRILVPLTHTHTLHCAE